MLVCVLCINMQWFFYILHFFSSFCSVRSLWCSTMEISYLFCCCVVFYFFLRWHCICMCLFVTRSTLLFRSIINVYSNVTLASDERYKKNMYGTWQCENQWCLPGIWFGNNNKICIKHVFSEICHQLAGKLNVAMLCAGKLEWKNVKQAYTYKIRALVDWIKCNERKYSCLRVVIVFYDMTMDFICYLMTINYEYKCIKSSKSFHAQECESHKNTPFHN